MVRRPVAIHAMISRCFTPAILLLALCVKGEAEAHPLGLSSINRYAGVKLHAREVEVDYLLDYAEMPAWSEIESLDADHDGAVTPAERDGYVRSLVARFLPTLDVRVDGARLALREVFHGVEAPPGQNGLSTLRVAVELRAPLPDHVGARCIVRLRDTYLAERSGWRELAAEASPAGRVVSSTVPAGTRAGPGLAYPTDERAQGAMRARPLRIDDATFVFERTEAAGPTSAAWRYLTRARADASTDGARLVGLLRDPQRSPWFVLFALGLAFALGAGHALSPGHGKALVGAWLVGARGRPRHALVLGASVTVAHTASVFLIGLLALAIEQRVGSDKLLRTLELASGALVAGIALSQLPARVRRMRGAPPDEHSHDHDHSHSHDHDHGHTHAPPDELSLRGLVALGASGGIVPCPGALVVLLAAIGMHRVAFGLALLVAFSLGLASVLTGIGLVFVMARRRFEHLNTDGRLLRVLPVLSSCAVCALGVVIALRALAK